MRTRSIRCLIFISLLLPMIAIHAQETQREDATDNKARIKLALQHMEGFEVRSRDDEEPASRIERPLLIFGDSARSNENGTLWTWGSGRPLAVLELYQPSDNTKNWIHAVTLTARETVSMTGPAGSKWAPEKVQIVPVPVPDAPALQKTEAGRTRQIKDIARRFSAHEFWDPDNSRYELRLLVQPVHRYQDKKAGVVDGAMFVFAHGTNPEILLLVEGLGESLEKAKWHYSLARMGSAEMHVSLSGEEVYREDRTPGIVGKSTDPYWLFFTPVESVPEED